MHKLILALAALGMSFGASAPALADWTFAVETDETGFEYARVSAEDTSGSASIYTECTKGVGLGLALILRASDTMIEQYGNQTADILYMNDVEGTALASVDYSPGDKILTLVTPEEETILPAWEVFAKAKDSVAVRFPLPPFPQIYEVKFATEGAAEAIAELRTYCE